MTAVDMLLAALRTEPEDLTTVCALTDALIEEQDMTRAEANRRAEDAVRIAREDRDLTEAARIMQPERPWHDELAGDVLAAAGHERFASVQIVVIPGDAPPTSSSVYRSNPGAFWYETTVRVGAVWLIHHYRTNPSLCLPVTRKRTRNTAKKGNTR